ncbi:unnamed protein product [Prorocentrum cordatum]|uniref:Uncharacterized protein n=1 Tax=Prorocentrum cordatum TaxID=2364126 RepID=A0ABN9U0M6_9DINO|nr:unnamed protein product [Polarella glacialis]
MAVTPSQAVLFTWIAAIAPSLSDWVAGFAAGRSALAAPGRAAAVGWGSEPPLWDCSCWHLPVVMRLAPDGAAAIEVLWPCVGGLAFSADLALAGRLGFGVLEELFVYWSRCAAWPDSTQLRGIRSGARLAVYPLTTGQSSRSLPYYVAEVVPLAVYLTDDVLHGLTVEARIEVASLRESEPDRHTPAGPSYCLSVDGRQRPPRRRRPQGEQVRLAGKESNPPVADAGAGAAESPGGAGYAGGSMLAADGERHRWLASKPGRIGELGIPVLHAYVMIGLGDRSVADIDGETVPMRSASETNVADYATLKTSAYEVAVRYVGGAPIYFGRRVEVVPSRAPSHGDGAEPTAPADAAEPSDVRTLWVDTDAMNDPLKSWRNEVMESYPTVWTDSPVEARVCPMFIPSHSDRHGDIVRRCLDLWSRSKILWPREQVIHEPSVLYEVIYEGGSYDQLNKPSLFIFECIVRRFQSNVDVYSGDSSWPQWASAGLHSSVGFAVVMVAPELEHYVAMTAVDEAEVESMRVQARILLISADVAAADGPPAAGRSAPVAAVAGQPSKGRGVYDTETAYATLAPYQRGAVSLPCDVSTAPAVGTLVTGRALEYLVEAEEQMIRTDAEVQLDRETNGEIKIYTDPLLANSRRRYSTFVKDPKRKGLVGFTRDPKEFVGVFFVWKKERASMRMVLDCRRSNQRFVTPPGVELLSTDGLGRIECDAEQTGTLPIFLGKADVKDCFHRMMFGNHLSKYFCYPGGLAKEFGIVGQLVEGVPARADDYLWPCALALPMGWTWSLYFAQVANLGLVERVPAAASSCAATDRGPPIVLSPTSSWHYVYVDNVGLMSLDASYVKGALADAIAAFDAAGLVMHDISVDSDTAEALGVTLDGRELEILLGHCAFVGLMCRETLSVWHTVYAFIRERYWAKSDMWESARQELECFLGLMPLLRSEWDRPWLTQVLSVDASPYGWGIASSEFGMSMVKKQGRISLAWWLTDTDPETSCLSLRIHLGPSTCRLKFPNRSRTQILLPAPYSTIAMMRTRGLEAPSQTIAGQRSWLTTVGARPMTTSCPPSATTGLTTTPTWLRPETLSMLDTGKVPLTRGSLVTLAAKRPAWATAAVTAAATAAAADVDSDGTTTAGEMERSLDGKTPAPLLVRCAIAVEFARRDELVMGVAVMNGVGCYLRPELLNLTSANLVAPGSLVSQYWSLLLHPSEREKRSQAGDADDSLIIVSAHMLPWGHDFLQALKEKGGRLWSFDCLTFWAKLKTVAVMLGLLHLVPCLMRHSWTWIDRLKPDRSQEESQRLGRWKRWKSLICYKSARLGSFWNELAAEMPAHDGTYMADLFSGSGKVARAVTRLGFSAKAWDIIHGPNHDLTDPAVLRLLFSDIRDGKIFAAMIALPCTSLTIARDSALREQGCQGGVHLQDLLALVWPPLVPPDRLNCPLYLGQFVCLPGVPWTTSCPELPSPVPGLSSPSLPELNGQLCYVLRPADSGGRVVARTSAGEKSLRPANLSCGLEACLPGRARTLGGALLALALASLADALRGGGALVPISMLAWLAFTLGFAWWLHRPSKAADAWLVSVSELSSCLPARTVYRIGFVIVSLHFAVSIRVYDSLLIGTLAPAPLPGAPLGATGAAGGAGAGGPESGAPGNGTEGGENMLLAAARRLQEPNGSARERMQLEGPWRSVRWGYVGAAGLAVQGAVPFDGSLSVPSALHLAGVGAFLSGAGQHCLLSAYVLGSSRGRRLLEAAPWLESVRELRSKAGHFKSIVRDSGMLKSMVALVGRGSMLRDDDGDDDDDEEEEDEEEHSC